MSKSWSHGRGCNCQACQKRRAYFRKYYSEHKERILAKNKKWMKENRVKAGRDSHAIGLKTKETITEKYGPDFYKDIARKKKPEKIAKTSDDIMSKINDLLGD